MATISGISKKTFMNATSAALANIKGAPVKLSQLRQFVSAQFQLKNEHLIEPMFTVQHAQSASEHQLDALDIDIGARGILFNQLQSMFVYTNEDGYIGGYWPDNQHADSEADDYFVPLSQVQWWQENAFVFHSQESCRSSLPMALSQDKRYRIVEVREVPELAKALIDAAMFSTLPVSEVKGAVHSLSHLFGASRDSYQKEMSLRMTNVTYPMYVYNALRYMLTRVLPAATYPNIEQADCVATFYGESSGFGENVSTLHLSQRIALWAASGDHGQSSQFLFSHMTGLQALKLQSTFKTEYEPYDADALMCCLQLLECIPEWKSRISEMAQYQKWRPYVEQWETLTSTLMGECNLTSQPLSCSSLKKTSHLLKHIKESSEPGRQRSRNHGLQQ